MRRVGPLHDAAVIFEIFLGETTMKKLTAIILALALLLTLAACGTGDDTSYNIAGRFVHKTDEGENPSIRLLDNGRFEFNANWVKHMLLIEGTYTFDDGIVKCNISQESLALYEELAGLESFRFRHERNALVYIEDFMMGITEYGHVFVLEVRTVIGEDEDKDEESDEPNESDEPDFDPEDEPPQPISHNRCCCDEPDCDCDEICLDPECEECGDGPVGDRPPLPPLPVGADPATILPKTFSEFVKFTRDAEREPNSDLGGNFDFDDIFDRILHLTGTWTIEYRYVYSRAAYIAHMSEQWGMELTMAAMEFESRNGHAGTVKPMELWLFFENDELEKYDIKTAQGPLRTLPRIERGTYLTEVHARVDVDTFSYDETTGFMYITSTPAFGDTVVNLTFYLDDDGLIRAEGWWNQFSPDIMGIRSIAWVELTEAN
jgi:hypothetical protein